MPCTGDRVHGRGVLAQGRLLTASAMAEFNITYVSINRHYPMYGELVASVRSAITELGYPCDITHNALKAGAVNILMGATIFASRYRRLAEHLRGSPYILYQLEQLHDIHGLARQWPEYWELLSNASWIWDYSPAGTRYLRECGLPHVSHLPPAFHPSLETFRPAPSPELDIVFCGSPHPRRERILDGLSAAGLKVVHLTGDYGEPRDRILASAKIVLNIHAWDDLCQLETVRLSHLLANHCFVVSETADNDPYENGLVYADYPMLVETCRDYLSRPQPVRAAIAEQGHEAIRKLKTVELLRAVLAES